MAKPITVNPKLTLVRRVLSATRPALVRGMGTLARVQVTPQAAESEATKLTAEVQLLLQKGLAGTQDTLLPAEAELPATGAAWLLCPLNQPRNAVHALPWCGSAVLYVKEGRPLAGGFMLPESEAPFVVCAGAGASMEGLGRCRVSGRIGLEDAVVFMPRNSGDAARLKLLELADTLPFHTRKTASPLADLVLVATGRADCMVATRTTPMEAALIELTMAESGGVVTRKGGTLLAGAPKIVAALAAQLPQLP